MNDVTTTRPSFGSGGLPAVFDPTLAKPVIETLRAAIDYAQRMRDWEKAWEAAELMVQWQGDFVRWWDATVGVRKAAAGGNAETRASSAVLRKTLPMAEAEEQTRITNQQVSHWRTGLRRPDYKARLIKPSFVKAMAEDGIRSEIVTGEMEWFTPPKYVEKVRRVLGSIDVDPASCAAAQRIVKARRFFTRETDGLTKKWKGTVFLNPPYSSALIAAFSKRLLEQLAAGHVTGAIMLTNAYTETKWFHNLARPSNALCLTLGRINFLSPREETASPTNGQCFFYFGDHRERFFTEFEDIGLVLRQAAE